MKSKAISLGRRYSGQEVPCLQLAAPPDANRGSRPAGNFVAEPRPAPVSRDAASLRIAAVFGLLIAGLGLFASCSIPLPSAQPDLTRYYLLTSQPARPEAKAEAAPKRWVIGVRNVEVPAYLRTKSFAIRSNANEVAFLDLARWGEPLEQGVERVLVENLQALPNVARISMQPFRVKEQRDFDVLVQILACEGATDGSVHFLASWRIVASTASANTVAEGNFEAAGLRWGGHDYSQLAAKLSDAVAGLSRDLAAALPK